MGERCDFMKFLKALVKRLLLLNNYASVLENFSKHIASRAIMYIFLFLVIIMIPAFLITEYMNLLGLLSSGAGGFAGIGAEHLFDWDILVLLFLSMAIAASYILVSTKNVARMKVAEDRATMLMFEAFLWPGEGFWSILIAPKLVRLLAASFMISLMAYIAAKMGMPAPSIGGPLIVTIYVALLHGIAGVELFSDRLLHRLWLYYRIILVGKRAIPYALTISSVIGTYYLMDAYVLGVGHGVVYIFLGTLLVLLFSLAVYYHYWLIFDEYVGVVGKKLKELYIKFSYVEKGQKEGQKDGESKRNGEEKPGEDGGEGERKQRNMGGEVVIYRGPLMDYLEKRVMMSYLISPGREGSVKSRTQQRPSSGEGDEKVGVNERYRTLIVLLMSYVTKKFYNRLRREFRQRPKKESSGSSDGAPRGDGGKCLLLMFYRVLNELAQLNISFTGEGHIDLLEKCFEDPTMSFSPTYAYGRMPTELLRWGDVIDASVTLWIGCEGGQKTAEGRGQGKAGDELGPQSST